MTPGDLRQYTALSFAQGAAQMILDDTIERFPEDLEVRGALARLRAKCERAKFYYPDPTPSEFERGKAMMEAFFVDVGWGGVAGTKERRRHPQTYLSFVAAILGDEARESMAARASTRPNGKERRLLAAEAEAGDAALVFKENRLCMAAAFRAAEIWRAAVSKEAILKGAESGPK